LLILQLIYLNLILSLKRKRDIAGKKSKLKKRGKKKMNKINDDLPEFPENNEDEEEKPEGSSFSNENLEELCGDIAAVPFEIWSILNPKVEKLTDTEKKAISRPLARLVEKYNLGTYAKDEFYLAIILTGVTFKRVNQAKPEKKKENVNINNRETGDGKDNLSKADNKNSELG
jgi:hypothetical protein